MSFTDKFVEQFLSTLMDSYLSLIVHMKVEQNSQPNLVSQLSCKSHPRLTGT